ncbi:hypothetical protein C0993_005455 [Termitomyces sp. T159_Od127]|nr:hypothetical protein C0993_005455 [Termitomyces sp. T159_Od127]
MAAPPTDGKVLILEGHIAGETGLINVEIDWLKKVIHLKKMIKQEKHITKCSADQLSLYKLGDEGVGYEALKISIDVIYRRQHSPPYDLAAHMKQVTCTLLEDYDYIYTSWPEDPQTTDKLSNKNDRLHFLVVLPDIIAPRVPATEADIHALVKEIGDWCARPEIANPQPRRETLLDLGRKFPLQQCDALLRKLCGHMLDSFRAKYADEKDWLKIFAIPIIGAAPGTGKTAICSRFLHEMAFRAINHTSPPTSTSPSCSSSETNIVSAPPDTTELEQIVSSCEEYPPEIFQFGQIACDDVWTTSRFDTFKKKLIKSAEQNLYLGIDLLQNGDNYSTNSWEAALAADLLDAYSHKDGTPCSWSGGTDLFDRFSEFERPLHVALKVLRGLQKDNIVIIHLDETQAVTPERLQSLVKVLVQQMAHANRDKIPWIFPILSGLSLETLLVSTSMSGAQIQRYTPPVLTIGSMMNIINNVIYGIKESSKKAEGQERKPRPTYQKGFIRLLHDLRGPTRFFQSALFFIQNYSAQVPIQPFNLGAVIDRDAIRAGLEQRTNEQWGDIFDLVADLIQSNQLCRNIVLLKNDPMLLRRLFQLNFLGEPVHVQETFTIKNETKPLSTLFDYGWATIVDSAKQGECTVFLPFLTLYKAAEHDPYAKYHPGLTPLCKSMDWKLVENDDARMLQYRLNRRVESEIFDTSLSDLFGQLGTVSDVQFRLKECPYAFRILDTRLESHQALSTLCSEETHPTVYLNAARAKFADSFLFLPQPTGLQSHVLCIQSKFFQSESSQLTYQKVADEHKKVADVCGEFPFTLVIPADRIGNQCRASLADTPTLSSSVLLLDSAGFDTFYGKPLASRRKIFAGLLDWPNVQAQAPQGIPELRTFNTDKYKKRESSPVPMVQQQHKKQKSQP